MPDRMIVCGVVVFSRIAGGLVIPLSVGAWLTGVTVTVNDCETVLLLPPLSVTVTVIVAVPLTLATGVMESEPVVLGLV